ncbi:conserved protein of unknown function [Tenacibaculum sp. 190524A02b]|uniref:hypothetical protein n=1 Tax=Tenacibaculum vairaonense TaxID=3137860 RepID=UPI0032B29A06
MKNDNYLDLFKSKQNAIYHATWMNFKYRVAKIISGVLYGRDDCFAVCEEATAKEMGRTFLDILPDYYSNLSYDDIQEIRTDVEPVMPWEEICGLFSATDGETLMYIIKMKIPLEKLIRYELALRERNEHNHFCGLEKAKEIWLK